MNKIHIKDISNVPAPTRAKHYIKDYINLFCNGNRFNIPIDRLCIERHGESCSVWIEFIHGGRINATYIGDYEKWSQKAKRWLLKRWYIGYVVLPDKSGPYFLRNGFQGRFMDRVKMMLDLDKERPLTFDDIAGIIRPGYEHFWIKGMEPGSDNPADQYEPISNDGFNLLEWMKDHGHEIYRFNQGGPEHA